MQSIRDFNVVLQIPLTNDDAPVPSSTNLEQWLPPWPACPRTTLAIPSTGMALRSCQHTGILSRKDPTTQAPFPLLFTSGGLHSRVQPLVRVQQLPHHTSARVLCKHLSATTSTWGELCKQLTATTSLWSELDGLSVHSALVLSKPRRHNIGKLLAATQCYFFPAWRGSIVSWNFRIRQGAVCPAAAQLHTKRM